MTIDNIKKKITVLDSQAMETAAGRWNSLAKPLHGMGKLEELVIKGAGICKNPNVRYDKKGIVVLCGDNGIVEEGISQTGSEVTAVVTENFLKGKTSVCKMAEIAKAKVLPYDIGVNTDIPGLTKKKYKIAHGTKNFLKEPAMTREQAEQAILTGVGIVEELKEQHFDILATGEMGIGNTTTSSAVACALTGYPVETMTGRGAGLSDEGLKRKIRVIRQGLQMYNLDSNDPVDILSKVGGLDIAGLTGGFLGCAAYKIPAVMDGFISSVAALVAVRIEPKTAAYLFASHRSKEPAHGLILKELGTEALLQCDMALGEGTGACTLFPLLDMALQVYHKMSSFQEIQVEQYEEYIK